MNSNPYEPTDFPSGVPTATASIPAKSKLPIYSCYLGIASMWCAVMGVVLTAIFGYIGLFIFILNLPLGIISLLTGFWGLSQSIKNPHFKGTVHCYIGVLASGLPLGVQFLIFILFLSNPEN